MTLPMLRPGPAVSRTVGTAAGSALALTLLTCGCVFAALAGPALSLHTRSQALHQTLAGYPDTTKTVQVNADWADFTGAVRNSQYGQPLPGQGLEADALPRSAGDIARGLASAPLPLAGGAWAGLNTSPLKVTAGAAPGARAGPPPRMEVVYRDPFTSYAKLVAGTYSGGQVPPGVVAVAATTQTAARFGLHPGSRLTLETRSGPATLFVTAIVAERAAGSTFWRQDTTIVRPSLVQQTVTSPPYWVGGVIADPGQFAAIQNAFGATGLEMQWEYPLDVSGVDANQAQNLYQALNRAVTTTPALTGALAPGANALLVTSPLIGDLSRFLSTQAAVETVLLLLFVSLIVIGAAVILLAARMIVARREGELAMLRARGGSLRQMATVMLRGALVAAGPGVLIGAGLAIAVIPGRDPSATSAGWPLAGVAIAAALAGPPLIAVWQHRGPAPAVNPARITSAGTRRPARAWRRPVAEVTAVAAAVAGLIVLRNQGVPAGGLRAGTDLYLTITPLLVAIPVVVIMLRLYPLAIRGLLGLSARGAGATGFVAMSRAARSPLAGTLPAFALVLSLSLATFAGMVSQGITRGEITASWHSTGADVLIQPGPGSGPVTPDAVKAISAVPGVRHAAAAWTTNLFTPLGEPVTVVAVDPARYAAMVADTPFPAFPAARFGTVPSAPSAPSAPSVGGTVPVLASPSAAAVLGKGTAQLSTPSAREPLRVRVTGLLASTPAQPAGGSFVIMRLETRPGPDGPPVPGMLLVTGSAINGARLAAVAGRVIPGTITTFRAAVLASLARSPLQHGAELIVTLTMAAAAAFGLFIVILGLALGSAERGMALARLSVMGYERPAGLVMAEAMSAVLTAIAAGVACAVALPQVIGPAIDLSAFTGTSAPVRLQPDALALGLPAVVIGVLALIALAAEARALRRRDMSVMLRAH
jgi:putative ABC transport system permease protein